MQVATDQPVAEEILTKESAAVLAKDWAAGLQAADLDADKSPHCRAAVAAVEGLVGGSSSPAMGPLVLGAVLASSSPPPSCSIGW